MISDQLVRMKSAIDEITKATTEFEVYKCLAEALVKHFSFNRVVIRKADWERGLLHPIYCLGFTEGSPSFAIPLSEKIGAFGRAALNGESTAVFEGDELLPELRLPLRFAGIKNGTQPRPFALVPIRVKGKVRVVIGVDRETSDKGITLEDKYVLDLFSEVVGKTVETVLAQEELNTALIGDELTGVFNRRYFMKRLDEEFGRAERYGVPLSCCIFDIDGFKAVNDAYGHIFGDQVLQKVSRLTAMLVRYTDIVARYGGEEFTILFTHTTLENAAIAAEHIRRAISTLVLPCNGKGVKVTATFGISSYPDPNITGSEELLHRADMALYEGKKRCNKNCVIVYRENEYKRAVRIEESSIGRCEERETVPDSFLPRGTGRREDTPKFELFNEKIGIKGECEGSKKPWEIPSRHLSKRQSLTILAGLGIILPIVILAFFINNKEDEDVSHFVDNKEKEEAISRPFSILTPYPIAQPSGSLISPISSQPEPNLSGRILLLGDRNLKEALKEMASLGRRTEIEKIKKGKKVSKFRGRKEKSLTPKQVAQAEGEWKILKEKELNKERELKGAREKEVREMLKSAFLSY